MPYESTYRAPGSKKLFGERGRFIVSCVFYKISLDIAYIFYLSEAFGNHFLTPFQLKFEILNYVESYVWLLLVSFVSPFTTRNMSGIFFGSVVLFLLVPLTTMYGLNSDQSRHSMILTVLALYTSFLASSVKAPQLIVPYPKNGYKIAMALCLANALLFLGVSIVTGALFRMNFDIGRVYEFRTEFSQSLDVGIFAYLNLWTQKIFTPFLLAVGLHRKNWMIVAFCIGMHILYFGLTQHRQHLFVPALVFFAWYVYKKQWPFTYGLILSGVFVLFSTILIMGLDLKVLGALIIRRAFFVAASVTEGWVHYFSENPYVYFSDNILSSFLATEYTNQSLPMYVGDRILPGLDLAYNAGIVATGFAQLGALGVVIYALIMGFYLRAINSLIRNGVPAFIPAAILFLPVRTAWAASDLFASLLSHGLIVGLLVVWLYGSHTQTDGKR